MISEKYPHVAVPLLFTLNSEVHELLVCARFIPGEFVERYNDDPEILGRIIQSTIGCWARAWTSIMQDEWIVSGKSASDQHEIPDDMDYPICTVQNKDWNGKTLTVHSYDNGQFAVNTFAGAAWAIDAILEAAPKTKIHIKNEQPKKAQQNTQPDTTQTSQADDDEPFVPPANQAPQEGNHNTSLLKEIQIFNDGSVFLPMAKENDVRKGRFADKQIDYNGKPRQYGDGELIVYRIFLIEPSTVGQNHLHTIKVTTTYGALNVFVNNRKGDEETFDFKTIRDSLAKVGIDANGEFRFNSPMAYVVKIAHGTDKDGKEIEYKNAYGLWRLPENES